MFGQLVKWCNCLIVKKNDSIGTSMHIGGIIRHNGTEQRNKRLQSSY